ncbi:hypothetical protein GSI_10785 [Ganoderma sinense ZZ0214-1]|uniref:Uncharacterized protein n=1 Tax=Ganoderma sinense ZZ0214-1 TaxID=1077348 RepID=A0A2G8S1I1_9APHY|nr:hypothetical protein GSI_10785 [Ganoderma sinense ZZ0214-1]
MTPLPDMESETLMPTYRKLPDEAFERVGRRQQSRPSHYRHVLVRSRIPGHLWINLTPPLYSVILGRAIKNEYLALGTIFGTVGLSMLATSGGKKEAPAAKPTLAQVKDTVKIDASSKEEEEFIRSFIAEAEKDSKH